MKDYVFHEVENGTFVGKCYGLEELVANMEEYCDGSAHLTVTASITLPTSVAGDTMRKRLNSAWLALRHNAPAIACKTYRLQAADRRFAFRYTVPRGEDDVQAWLNETVFIFDEKRDIPLYDEHCRLKDGHWWRCSDDHYVLELHVSRMANDYAFSLVFSHNVTDGRNALAVLDLFLGFLDWELRNESESNNYAWGDEIVRLPPPGALASSIAKTSHSPEITPTVERPNDQEKGTTPVHWFYPNRVTGHNGDTSRLVQFSEELSENLHEICNKKGRTITQVITALSALAHTEASLNAAGKAGRERFQEVVDAYYSTSHYLVPWNFINQRPRLPADTSLALCTADCVPVSFPMDAIRSCITIDKDTQSATRTVNEAAFWDVLVKDVSDSWSNLDQSLDVYAVRENVLHNLCNNFTPQIFDLPAMIVSSLGDLRRLDLLSSFVPASDGEPKTRLLVNDIICGVRIRTPPIMNILWEYRGKIACHFMAGAEHTTPDNSTSMTGAFEEWTKAPVRDIRSP